MKLYSLVADLRTLYTTQESIHELKQRIEDMDGTKAYLEVLGINIPVKCTKEILREILATAESDIIIELNAVRNEIREIV